MDCSPPRLPVLAVALVLGAAACSKPKVSHVLTFTGSPKTVELRVTVNGQVRGPYRVSAPDGELKVDLGAFEQSPALSAQALLPCGWSDVPVQHVGGTETEQRHVARVAAGKTSIGVWVDNRGGGAVKAGLGQIELPIAAGFTGSFQLPAPDCEAGAKLRLGEAELPVVRASDLPPKDKRPAPAYLIDGSGARCYRTRAVNYASLPGIIRMAGPAEEGLRPARLHALFANVDYFLEPAPEQIQAERFASSAWKHELTEQACSPPAK